MSVFASFFGILGIVANLAIYKQNNRQRLLTAKLIADILWTFHYAFLSAWSGAAICGIGIMREMIFIHNQRQEKKNKLWLIFFLTCAIISAAFTWKNVFSILPACASFVSVVSFWIGNPVLTRILQFPISIAFLTYNIISLSYTGILNELMTLTILIIVIYRTTLKKY